MNEEIIKALEEIKAKNITTIDEAIASLKPVWIPPKDTPVYVRDNESCAWDSRYSANEIKDNKLVCYPNGRTSFTVTDTRSEGITVPWKFWKPAPEIPTAINWLENTGVMPDCKWVLVKFKGGQYGCSLTAGYNWELSNCDHSIIEYAILE